MANDFPGTFELIALELARALEPLADRIHEPHHALILLTELGLRIPEHSISPSVATALQTLHRAVHELPDLSQALVIAIENGEALDIISKGVPIAQQLALLIDSFDTLANELSALGAIPGVSAPDFNAFLAALPKRLFETVLVEYLEGYRKVPLALFEVFGIIEKDRQNIGSTDPGHPEIVVKQLRFDRIGMLLQSPDQLLDSLYGWGTATFTGDLLIRRVASLLSALRIPITYRQLNGVTPRSAIEFCVATLTTTEGLNPPGIEAIFAMNVADGITIDLPIVVGWQAHLHAEGALQSSASLRIQPPANITLVPPSGSAQGRLTAGIASVPVPPAKKITLLALAGGTGLSAERIELSLIGGFRWNTATGSAEGDFGFEGNVRGGLIRISMAGADGFIGNVLSGVSVESNFNVGLGWTANQGVYFSGSSALEIQLPAHISLGPVELSALTLAVGIDGSRFPIILATNIKASLGPLQAVVETIGAGVELSFPASGKGDIGPIDLDFTFKPPNGVGLSLDAGVVKGGGYLYFDFDREEYAGVLELDIAKIVTVKAIGLINTKMPDGSKGFSLLIIITAEFGAGVQLGFGFTLIGLGGLLGLNRTMNLPPLMEGVRTGAINSIMFPENPVANAPRIISDLRLIFPPYVGKFLIGPMAKLGWGTPTLISVAMGVIIEIPGNIAILGVLKVALPAEDAPLIVIQVNFAGAIEFDKQRLYFFATLFESRVLFLTIEGDMGLLVAWGGDANFVVSVGGFHPRFNPPPLPFPSPRRIAIDILNTPVYRIRTECYFAVTSNTVQFGSQTELMIDVGVAQVQGHMTFDALFQFSPFYFIVEISAGVSLKVFGMGLFSIRLQFALEGPTPWRAHGSGSISFLFFDVSADFDVTWGDSQDTTLPPIPVMPLLKAELEKQQNWIAELPKGNKLLVSLRKLSENESSQVLHPLGTLRISQRAAPLDIKIDKIGCQKPADANQFKLVSSGDLVKVSDADEQFAKAQFINMSDADKLSQRAFDPLHGGLKLASGTQNLGSAKMAKRKVRYEQIIIDNNFKRFSLRFIIISVGFFTHFLAGSAITKSVLSKNYRSQIDPFTEKLQVKDGGFTVALAENNQAYNMQAMDFSSETLAQQYIQEQVALRPELHETLHVIPRHEVAAAA